MAGRKHIIREIPPEKLADLEALRYSVKRAEEKGNMDTCHHEMLRRLESELGLIPEQKDTREQIDEVTNGE